MPTCDRPRFLSIALACYAHQTYLRRELIVIDDGARHPADETAITAVGGRLIRVEPGTPLGSKLNRGADEAQGPLCLKMDDDDWYAPSFLDAMVSGLLASWTVVCRPTVAFLSPFLWFDLNRWEVRRSFEGSLPGGTLLFGREAWQERSFRAVARDEDVWFLLDQTGAGVRGLPVRAVETFMAVRHTGGGSERGHTWTHGPSGQPIERDVAELPRYRHPEALLPDWAIATYRTLRRELLAADR